MSITLPPRQPATDVECFGPYRLEERLGAGGTGEVFRAYDTVRERTVALKRLRPDLSDDEGYAEHVRRATRVAARLASPHVIPIHDVGTIDGALFVDMALVGASTSPGRSPSTARSGRRAPRPSCAGWRTRWTTRTPTDSCTAP